MNILEQRRWELEWFFLAALSAFFAALAAIFAKIGLQSIDSTVAAAARAIIMMIFIVSFVLIIGKSHQLTQLATRDMGFIILSGVAGALSWLLFFAALKIADASRVSLVDRASVLIVIVLSALLLDEKITLKTAAAGILIFSGLLLLSTQATE
ncbi:MAG: EamA family transporter [Candidatus Bathyarchaeota archaeon]|nr:MAG: EamA family transporter [Candidatus Bathyarchaeota archaeon]